MAEDAPLPTTVWPSPDEPWIGDEIAFLSSIVQDAIISPLLRLEPGLQPHDLKILADMTLRQYEIAAVYYMYRAFSNVSEMMKTIFIPPSLAALHAGFTKEHQHLQFWGMSSDVSCVEFRPHCDRRVIGYFVAARIRLELNEEGNQEHGLGGLARMEHCAQLAIGTYPIHASEQGDECGVLFPLASFVRNLHEASPPTATTLAKPTPLEHAVDVWTTRNRVQDMTFVRVLWNLSQCVCGSAKTLALMVYNSAVVLRTAGISRGLPRKLILSQYEHADEEPRPPALVMPDPVHDADGASVPQLAPDLSGLDPLRAPFVTIAPDGSYYLATQGSKVHVYSFTQESPLPSKILQHADEVSAVSITENGEHIVTACRKGLISVWILDEDYPLLEYDLRMPIFEMCLPSEDLECIVVSVKSDGPAGPLDFRGDKLATIRRISRPDGTPGPDISLSDGVVCSGSFSRISADRSTIAEYVDGESTIYVRAFESGLSLTHKLLSPDGILSVGASSNYVVAVTDVHSIRIVNLRTGIVRDIASTTTYPMCICANCRLCPGNLSKFVGFRKEPIVPANPEFDALQSLLGRVKGFQVTEAFKIHNGSRSVCFQHGLYSMSMPFSPPPATVDKLESTLEQESDGGSSAKRMRTEDGSVAPPAAALPTGPAAPAPSAPAPSQGAMTPSELLRLYLLCCDVPFVPRHMLPSPRLPNVPVATSPPCAAQVVANTNDATLAQMLSTSGINQEAFQKVNAQWLFHTPTGPVDRLLLKSLDCRFSKIGSFGRGCYFTDSIEKASTYYRLDWGVQHDPNRADEKFVLVCLVALGRTRNFNPLDKDSSLYCEPRGFDSVVGFVQGWKEFVVYNPDRVFVSYLVYYKGSQAVSATPLTAPVSAPARPLAAPPSAPPPGTSAQGTTTAPTNVVYIPASLKTFFNELINRTTAESPQKGAQAKLCISKLLRNQMTVKEFLTDVSKLLGSEPPTGLEESITQRLQNVSNTPTGQPMGIAAAVAATLGAQAVGAAPAADPTPPPTAAAPPQDTRSLAAIRAAENAAALAKLDDHVTAAAAAPQPPSPPPPPAAAAVPPPPAAAGTSAPASSVVPPVRVSKVYIQSSLRDFFEELIKRAEAKSPASAHLVKVRITALLTQAIDAKLFLSDMSYVLGVPSPEGLEQNLRQQLEKVRFPTPEEQEADAKAAADAAAAGLPPPTAPNTLSLALTPPAAASSIGVTVAPAGRSAWGHALAGATTVAARARLPKLEETASQDVEGLVLSTEVPSEQQAVLSSGDVVVPLPLARYFRSLQRLAVDVRAHRAVTIAISDYIRSRGTETFLAKVCDALHADPPQGLAEALHALITASSVPAPYAPRPAPAPL